MPKPGFIELIGAIFYDLLLVVAVLFFATMLALPLNGGKAFDNSLGYSAYLVTCCFLYYGWFWTHGGQTLGLKTWKIRLISENNQSISWKQAFIRFFVAILSGFCLGLGFIWMFFDKHQRSWHDIASKTSLFERIL